MIDPTSEGIWQQAQRELREETGFRADRLEKLLDFNSHPGYIAHKVHLLVAYDLEWDPLEIEEEEQGVSLFEACTSRMRRNLVASIAAKMRTKPLPDCHRHASFA